MYLRLCLICPLIWPILMSAGAFECPKGPECDECQVPLEDVYEINCATNSHGIVQAQIRPDSYVRLVCRNSANWTKFHLGESQSIRGIKSVSFDTCNLPEDNGLELITRRLFVEDVETLRFRSSFKYGATIERRNLHGLSSLRELTLTEVDLTNAPEDLFQDLPNLVKLNLQKTNLKRLPRNFFRSKNLEAIELSTNQLANLDSSVFQNLERLRLLSIWNNKLVEISPNTFDELSSLETLNLRRNKLENLPSDLFQSLGNLKILRLSENNFLPNSLGRDLLRSCHSLEVFELANNRKNLTTLPNGFFGNLTKLGAIKLRKIGVSSLPEDLFWGVTNLKNISIERNYLSTLPSRIFKDNNDIFSIDLNFNELSSLPDDIFSNLKKLTKLDLSKNHLTHISEKLFSGLTSLRELNMENNNMISVHHNAFRSLRELRIAKFSYNALTLESTSESMSELAWESPFHFCENLEEIYLDHNNISNIFVDWMFSMGSLHVINLSYNRLQHLTHEDLQFLSEHLRVDLSHNNISHIYLNGIDSWASYLTYSRDVVITIENNPISCDCDLYDLLRYFEGRLHPNAKKAFRLEIGKMRCTGPDELRGVAISDLESKTLKCEANIPELETHCPSSCTCLIRPENKTCIINCANGNLTEAPPEIECPINHWIELDLSNNHITDLPNLGQRGYERVIVLNLDHNNVSKISADNLSSILKELKLDSNNLSRLDQATIDFLNNSTQLTKLTLESNPWQCDCETREFLSFVQQNSPILPDLQNVTCSDRDEAIFRMTTEEFCPSNVNLIIIAASLGISFFGILIGILAALYYRYQREIKVWLYAKNCCLWLVTEDELDKDKLFDAFISYSHKDEDFVVNHLIPNLEAGPRPFKLCVHFRDWLAGDWIPKQIARSVDDSRRTIVVLSPNFLESVWGRMEFRAAHSQALSEGRARVIVILYGEIGPTDDLDPELQAYLSMNTYVKWGDPWFWQKLNYAMPHPPEFTKSKWRKNIYERTQPRIELSHDNVVANEKKILYDESREGVSPV